MGTVDSYLVPSRRVIRQGIIGLVWENMIKEMIEGVDTALTGFYIKVILTGQYFAISGN